MKSNRAGERSQHEDSDRGWRVQTKFDRCGSLRGDFVRFAAIGSARRLRGFADRRWGNGTLDAFLAGGGQRISLQVLDPLLRPVQAEYGLIDSGTTAIIEMARSSGLELLQPAELNPLIASTYGTGQLMLDALERGAGRMIIGLGGSATVDGGMGCMSALGVRLLDAAGDEIGPWRNGFG